MAVTMFTMTEHSVEVRPKMFCLSPSGTDVLYLFVGLINVLTGKYTVYLEFRSVSPNKM